MCQDSNQAVDIEDNGLTFSLFPGARPAGLAGAYTALGGDVHSLVYNPAGLAQTRRIEASIGFVHDRYDNTNTYYGQSGDADHTTSNLDYLSVAYPFPTYRGSLVGAIGIYRGFSSEMDLFYNGFNSDTETLDNYILQQSGSIYSYNIGFGFDMSSTLSSGASFFILDGTLKALTQFSFAFPGPIGQGELSKVFFDDDVEGDLDGFGGRLGIQFKPLEQFTCGLTVTTPIWITLGGKYNTTEIYYFENEFDSIAESFGTIEDVDYRLPFQIDLGVAFEPNENLLLSLDLGYTDWTETTIEKAQIKTDCPEGVPCQRSPVFREVLNFRTGIEATIPGIALRFRGGYAYLPYPLEYLQADRITNDSLAAADIDTERQLFTLGAGGLVSKILALDFAFVYATGERSISTLDYKRTSKSYLLSASYRF